MLGAEPGRDRAWGRASDGRSAEVLDCAVWVVAGVGRAGAVEVRMAEGLLAAAWAAVASLRLGGRMLDEGGPGTNADGPATDGR